MLACLLLAGSIYFAPSALLSAGPHHTRHYELLRAGAPAYNKYVLMGIDRVQATAPDGGGYFVGVHATPAESPIGYDLKLFGSPLLAPPRSSSYCSGSSYSAFIEGLNAYYLHDQPVVPAKNLEAMRMQEPDGARREDGVKAWGWWNADGFGSEYALVQYLGMGERVRPEDARPGDFMNISWKRGLGHSVVFLGWCNGADGPEVVYWASQKGTNGLGDQVSPLSRIKDLCAVRLTHPERVTSFDAGATVDPHVPGDSPPSF